MTDDIGSVLRTARIARKLTQQNVADALGVSRAAVGLWESGTHEPSTDNLIAICQLLRINIDAAARGHFIELDADQFLPHSQRDPGTAKFSPPLLPDEMRGRKSSFSRLLNRDRDAWDTSFRNGLWVYFSIPDDRPEYFLVSTRTQHRDRAPRPLQGNETAYVLAIPDGRLRPRYDDGEHIYLNAAGQPKIGDYVLYRSGEIIERSDPAGGSSLPFERCALGRFESADAFGFTLRLHQPDCAFSVPQGDRASIHRVYPWHELLTK